MTPPDFRKVAQAFGRAAIRARNAGFDGVQIFAAHGFFLSQMLSPRYNDRTDGYGGEIQNRARALLEVLGEIRDRLGEAYPVLAKVNVQDLVEGGLTLEDSLRVGAMLEAGGIDAIELSGGLLNLPNLMTERAETEGGGAYFEAEAKAFKERIQVPLILVGGIRSYETAERLVKEGTVEYVALCRPLIREPDLVSRWQGGDLARATCISCNNCVEHIKRGDGPICEPLRPEVAETFFPALSETVPASAPHPPGTCYVISVGLEQWGSNFVPVVKVQMAHGGKVSQRSPSFPLGSDDHRQVGRAIDELLRRHAAQSKE
jgi:2,4-dienoyl-CoA reductase-like NADH-dependent reductase (Old Yellow Enzyme family)